MNTSLNLGPTLKRFSYGSGAHPARDWFYLLMLALVLVAVSVAWNVWLLRSVEQGSVLGEQPLPTSFDATPIESVRTVFELRETEAARYRTEYRFVDPSR